MHPPRSGLTTIEIAIAGMIGLILVIGIPYLVFDYLRSSSTAMHTSVQELLAERAQQEEARSATRAKHPPGSERRLGDSDRRVMVVRYDTEGIVVLLDNGASLTVDAAVLKPLQPAQPEATAPTP
jgi:hypothetical protein